MNVEERLSQLERKLYDVNHRAEHTRDMLDMLLNHLNLRITNESRWRVDKMWSWWRI